MTANGNGKFKLDTVKEFADIRGEIRELKNNYTEIKTNHLAHLQTKIDSVDTKLDDMKVANSRWNGVFTTINGIAIGVLIYLITRG